MRDDNDELSLTPWMNKHYAGEPSYNYEVWHKQDGRLFVEKTEEEAVLAINLDIDGRKENYEPFNRADYEIKRIEI